MVTCRKCKVRRRGLSRGMASAGVAMPWAKSAEQDLHDQCQQMPGIDREFWAWVFVIMIALSAPRSADAASSSTQQLQVAVDIGREPPHRRRCRQRRRPQAR